MNSKEILKEYHEYSEANILDKAEAMYKTGYIYDVEMALGHEKLKYDKVLKDLDRLEKLEQVIEILKTKSISISDIKTSKNVTDYNSRIILNYSKNKLTKEEFDLLKEVLDDGK